MRRSALFVVRSMVVVVICCSGIWSGLASADVAYETNFDTLDLGQTQPLPGAAGQDGWYRQLAEGDAFGEIQDAIANAGRALHQHTAATVPPALQTIDRRNIGPINLSQVQTITLELDFYATTSDLSAVNNYIADFEAGGGPAPGFRIINFGLGAGNGQSKSVTGLNVQLSAFDAVADNNVPISLAVGQQLTWDTWHEISLTLDQQADTWLSITVDGQTESLVGYRPPRSFDGTEWLRGEQIDFLSGAIIPDDVGGDRTDDDVYWDNVSLRMERIPEPGSFFLFGAGLIGLVGYFRLRRR